MDPTLYVRAALALVAVVALIALFALAARRLGFGHGARWGDRRLEVVETLQLDPRRRVLMLRVDRREYAVLLGASGETLLGAEGTGAERDSPKVPVSHPPADKAPPAARTKTPAEPAFSGGSIPERQPTDSAPHHGRRPRREEPKLTPPLPMPKPRP